MSKKCQCDMRTRLVGDGCEHCNPQMTIDLLKERVQELEAAATLTDAELAFLDLHIERVRWWAHSCPVSQKELETVIGMRARLGGEK